MNCEIQSVLYVKANGEALCHDDYGERVSLGRIGAADGWSIREILEGPGYWNIPESFAAGRSPWPGVCEHCAFLRPLEEGGGSLARKTIQTLQMEPSLACALACPACSQPLQIKQRAGPHVMALEVYERLLKSCRDEGYSIEALEHCGQGEPLSNPAFSQFVRRARELFPATRQRLITNGNYSYQKTLGDERLDEIYVSCDGLYQENYEKYRIHGDVGLALRFMQEAKAAQPSTVVIWKYILFEFNDSNEELAAAQHKAAELGVDCLLFVLTHSIHKSIRFTRETIHTLPLFSPVARTNATPIQMRLDRRGVLSELKLSGKTGLFGWSRAGACGRCVVDEAALRNGERLCLTGWAVDRSGGRLKALEVKLNGRALGAATLGLPRGDVLKVFPAFASDRVGFFANVPLNRVGCNGELELKLTGGDGGVETFKARIEFE